MANPHVGAVSFRVLVTVTDQGVPKDISAASTKQILLKPPAGPVKTFNASFLVAGADGVIFYDTVAGDLGTNNTLAGVWRVQVNIVTPSWSDYTEVGTFVVDPILT